MNAKIITISREFGSGGRSIGKLVAEQLGYAFYDKALVERIAKESGYAEDFIERRGEDATSKSSFLFNLSRSGGGGFDGMPAITDKLYVIQYNTIKKLAEEHMTMVIVTHEMAFARDVADQIIFMDDGLIVEQGDPKQVIDNPKEERTKQFLTRYTEG